MSTNPAADRIARLLVERDDLLLEGRELEARMDRLRRRLDDVNAEIVSLRKVESELLERHPELRRD